MTNSKRFSNRVIIIMGLAMVFLLGAVGCVGYVDGGPGVVATGPDFFLFGGGYDRGRDVHGYSHRGAVSRGVAHGGGGHVGGGRR